MAFEEVCPDRIDLIHKNYRKLCNLLVDVEEWGQVVIINMLTRYARTQFLNPNMNVSTAGPHILCLHGCVFVCVWVYSLCVGARVRVCVCVSVLLHSSLPLSIGIPVGGGWWREGLLWL